MSSSTPAHELPQPCDGDESATSSASLAPAPVTPRGAESAPPRETPDVGTPATLVTFVTHAAPELEKLRASAAAVGAELTVVTVQERFGARYGWGPRLLAMHEFVADTTRFPDPTAVVFCVDGFDVLIKRPLAVAVAEFEAMTSAQLGGCVLLSAETACSPDGSIAHLFPPTGTPYVYPNAGTLMGHVGALRQLLGEHLDEFKVRMDDQYWWQGRYLAEMHNGSNRRVLLDSSSRVFQCLWNAKDHFERDPASGLWSNKITGCVVVRRGSTAPPLTLSSAARCPSSGTAMAGSTPFSSIRSASSTALQLQPRDCALVLTI
jgi:hypothetical protein